MQGPAGALARVRPMMKESHTAARQLGAIRNAIYAR
jgi:hypothetical protein